MIDLFWEVDQDDKYVEANTTETNSEIEMGNYIYDHIRFFWSSDTWKTYWHHRKISVDSIAIFRNGKMALVSKTRLTDDNFISFCHRPDVDTHVELPDNPLVDHSEPSYVKWESTEEYCIELHNTLDGFRDASTDSVWDKSEKHFVYKNTGTPEITKAADFRDLTTKPIKRTLLHLRCRSPLWKRVPRDIFRLLWKYSLDAHAEHHSEEFGFRKQKGKVYVVDKKVTAIYDEIPGPYGYKMWLMAGKRSDSCDSGFVYVILKPDKRLRRTGVVKISAPGMETITSAQYIDPKRGRTKEDIFYEYFKYELLVTEFNVSVYFSW